MKTAFLLAHFKWHKKLKLKTSDEYPVTVTKKHYYHVTDGISNLDLYSEADVASYCESRGFRLGKAKKKNIF